ncbi:hypothetical protein NX059_000638 [Plenodomus lindquistii]|nr:hypothetical protein NX059_000638 [Plenodomus lindquistii]
MANSDEEEELPDPFAQSISPHPALGALQDTTSDIFAPLFDGFFNSELFDRWLHRKNTWQLYLVGGPGAGKTTLPTLTMQRILAEFAQSFGIKNQAAAVFVRHVMIENELAFLEDFLDDVYRQLTPLVLFTNHAASQKYERYADARNRSKRVSTRVELISQAL